MTASRDPGWHWRNCRSLGLSIHVHIWPWHFGAELDDDVYGGRRSLHFGFFGVSLHYDIGNRSSENRIVAAGALCEIEAWERACRYEGIAP